jgi:hypothetical protein
MAKTDFRYSDTDFFRSICPDYGKYLSRVHLKDFLQVSGDKWQMGSVGTRPSQVYFDGMEGTEVANYSDVDSVKEWHYSENDDLLTIYVRNTNDNPNDDEVIEIGEDTKTFIEQQLTNASMMLNSLIISVLTPIPKSFIYNDTEGTETPEYDYVLKRAECLLAYSSLADAEGEFELADRLYAQVTNFEKTGIVDKINSGDIQLSPFRESVDSSGKIIKGSVSGSMEIELSGSYTGQRYERYKIEVTTTGGYGVGKWKYYSSNSDQLYGNVSSEFTISGQMQSLGSGLFVRFEGNSATDGDIFFVECRNDTPTNSKANTIELWR